MTRVAVMTIGSPTELVDPGFLLTHVRESGATVVRNARSESEQSLVERRLAAWIADVEVDAIIVLGGQDGEVAARALAPHVTETLGRLADGTATMLRAQAKLVFLVHSSTDVQLRAFDELIRPALAVPASDGVMELDEVGGHELTERVIALPMPPQLAARAQAQEKRLGAAAFAPRKASIGLLPKVLMAVALLAMAAVLVVFFVTHGKSAALPPAPPPPLVAIAPAEPAVDAAVAVVVAMADAAESEEIAIDVDPTPTPPPHAPASPPSGRPVARPAQPAGSAGSTPAPPPDAAVEAAPTPPPGEDCDQVSCALDKNARPCCEAFRTKAPAREADGTRETLDKTAVRVAVESVKPVVIACGEKAKVKGTVKVALDVAPDGSVTAATVNESPDPELGNCVAAALRRVHFAKTHDGASFVYPFIF